MRKITQSCNIVKLSHDELSYQQDLLATECPVEIIINQQLITTLYASPDNLTELAVGFAVAKGYLLHKESLQQIQIEQQSDKYQAFLQVVAGAGSIGIIKAKCDLPNLTMTRADELLADYSLKLREIPELINSFTNKSQVFKSTGAVHSVALCQGSEILFLAEDVARYNAFNKALGYKFLNFPDMLDGCLLLSGRIAGEMIEECLKFGISLLISKSAPLSLSVELAKKYNVGLIGFVRGQGLNIYNL